MINPFNRLPRSIADFLHEHVPWSTVVYAKIEYGFPWRDLFKMWNESEGKDRKTIIGGEHTKAVDFFSKCAHRSHEESETYRCVNGCCVVWWHPKRGNLGGFGPAGCSCDSLDDPRGEKVDNA